MLFEKWVFLDGFGMQLCMHPILKSGLSDSLNVAGARTESQSLECMQNLRIRCTPILGVGFHRGESDCDCEKRKKVALQHDVPPRCLSFDSNPAVSCVQYRQPG